MRFLPVAMLIALAAIGVVAWRFILTRRRIAMQTQAEVDAAIAALKTEVERETTIETSARALILGIDARIAGAIAAFQAANPAVDVSALAALTESIRHSSSQLSDAVAANTPAAPPETP